MKRGITRETRTLNQTQAMEFSLETVLIYDPKAVEQFSSINLKFIRLLIKLQLPETAKETEESKSDHQDK